jgi:hypothetical protein
MKDVLIDKYGNVKTEMDVLMDAIIIIDRRINAISQQLHNINNDLAEIKLQLNKEENKHD